MTNRKNELTETPEPEPTKTNPSTILTKNFEEEHAIQIRLHTTNAWIAWSNHWRRITRRCFNCRKWTTRKIATMNKQEIKEQIKESFGTMARFSRIAGIKASDVWFVLSPRNKDEQAVKEMFVVFKSFRNIHCNEQITDQERSWIEGEIFFQFKTRSRLTRAFPQFSDSFLSNLINGKLKYKTKRVEKLVEILKELDVNSTTYWSNIATSNQLQREMTILKNPSGFIPSVALVCIGSTTYGRKGFFLTLNNAWRLGEDISNTFFERILQAFEVRSFVGSLVIESESFRIGFLLERWRNRSWTWSICHRKKEAFRRNRNKRKHNRKDFDLFRKRTTNWTTKNNGVSFDHACFLESIPTKRTTFWTTNGQQTDNEWTTNEHKQERKKERRKESFFNRRKTNVRPFWY